jgi:hypothetical protein
MTNLLTSDQLPEIHQQPLFTAEVEKIEQAIALLTEISKDTLPDPLFENAIGGLQELLTYQQKKHRIQLSLSQLQATDPTYKGRWRITGIGYLNGRVAHLILK